MENAINVDNLSKVKQLVKNGANINGTTIENLQFIEHAL